MAFIGPDTDQEATPAASGGFVGPDTDQEVKPIGTMETLGRAALNNFPLGTQAAAAIEPGDYSQNIADLTTKAEAAKKENPITYGVGATAGALAPLAIPGVGEAMEAAPVASGAALGAAGALSNTDLTKNGEKNLEEGAKGAVMGGALGKVGDVFGDMFTGVTPKIEAAADTARTQGMGLSPKLLGKLSPDELSEYADFAKDHALVGLDPEKALGNAQAIKAEFGRQIQESGAGAMPIENAAPYWKDLIKEADKLEGVDGAQRDIRQYYQGAQNIIDKGKTFADLQQLKTFYGEKAFDAFHQVKDPVAADIWGQIRQAMTDATENAPGDYKAALKGYKMANDAVDGLQRKLNAARAGNGPQGIGFMGRVVGKLPGQSNPAINLPTAAAIGAAGHPMWGLMAASPSFQNPAVRAQLLDKLAASSPELAKMSRPALMALIDKMTSKGKPQ